MDYLSEASYKTSPILTEVESQFTKLIAYVKKFYDAMKAAGLNPRSANDIYKYYSSDKTDDKFLYTQYNEYLKRIEDLVKKMFKFRSVNIEFQLLSVDGPHTRLDHKSLMKIPIMQGIGASISDIPDLGVRDGNKFQIGYPSKLRASAKGITDTSDAIEIDIKLQMYEELNAKHYVAILLHEIGHNLDMHTVNVQVKNTSKMISVLSTATNKSDKDIPGKIKVFFTLIKEKIKTRKTFEEILGNILAEVGGTITTGGDDKYGELFADSLPNAFGYGPYLIKAINMLAPSIRKTKDFKSVKGVISAMHNFDKAIVLLKDVQRRENDPHGSNLYRAKKMIQTLESDLKNISDPNLKRRIRRNIDELDKIIKDMTDNPDIPPDVNRMLQAWADSIK